MKNTVGLTLSLGLILFTAVSPAHALTSDGLTNAPEGGVVILPNLDHRAIAHNIRMDLRVDGVKLTLEEGAYQKLLNIKVGANQDQTVHAHLEFNKGSNVYHGECTLLQSFSKVAIETCQFLDSKGHAVSRLDLMAALGRQAEYSGLLGSNYLEMTRNSVETKVIAKISPFISSSGKKAYLSPKVSAVIESDEVDSDRHVDLDQEIKVKKIQ